MTNRMLGCLCLAAMLATAPWAGGAPPRRPSDPVKPEPAKPEERPSDPAAEPKPAVPPKPAPKPEEEPAAPKPPAKPIAGDPGDKPAPRSELARKVLAAYQALDTYHARTVFTEKRKEGRWTRTQSAVYEVAWVRKGGRLKIDHWFYDIVNDEGKFRLRSEDFPGAFLEIDSPKPLDYVAVLSEVLSQGQSLLAEPALPDLALLLADDGFFALAGENAGLVGLVRDPNHVPAALVLKELPPDKDDARKRPRLQVADAMGSVWTFHIDPKTSLATSVLKETDPGEEGMTHAYEVQLLASGQPVADAIFEFDIAGAQPAKSLQDMVKLSAQLQGQGGPKHPLQGKKAPDFQVKDLLGKEVKLSERIADKDVEVVVLDFWATWCGPCRKGLPVLNTIDQWVKEKKLPVAIYAVNIQEEEAVVSKFIAKSNFTFATLLDTEGKAAGKYMVQSIPQTVIIHKGKVLSVTIGLEEDLEAALKRRIESLVGDGKGKAKGKEKPGDAKDPKKEPDAAKPEVGQAKEQVP